jgi:hypothetical protein
MTFSDYLTVLLAVALLVVCAGLARIIWTGELPREGATIRRAQSPSDYWFEVALVLALVGSLAVSLILSRTSHRDSAGVVVFAGGFLLPMILRALRYGRIHGLAGPCTRVDRPTGYWTTIALMVAFLAATVATLAFL